VALIGSLILLGSDDRNPITRRSVSIPHSWAVFPFWMLLHYQRWAQSWILSPLQLHYMERRLSKSIGDQYLLSAECGVGPELPDRICYVQMLFLFYIFYAAIK